MYSFQADPFARKPRSQGSQEILTHASSGVDREHLRAFTLGRRLSIPWQLFVGWETAQLSLVAEKAGGYV